MRKFVTLGAVAVSAIVATAVPASRLAAQSPTDTIRLSIQSHASAGQKCIDIAGAQFVAGMRLQTFDCHYKSSEIFAYDQGNQRLVIGHLCVESWGPGADDDAVGLGACTGAVNQHWRMNANGDYYQIVGANNLCLELRKADKGNGAALQIAKCTAQPQQLWALIQPPAPEAAKCTQILRRTFADSCNGCTKPPRDHVIRRTAEGWVVQYVDANGKAISFDGYRLVSESDTEILMYDQSRDYHARFDLFGRKVYLRRGTTGDWTPMADILLTDC